MENRFTSDRIIDGKRRRVIVDINGNVIYRNPSKDELIGLKDENCRKKSHERYTNEELLHCLRQFKEENGRFPTTIDLTNNPRYPGKTIYHTRFGGLNNALEKSGLDVKSKSHRNLSDEELLDCLLQFYDENRRVPVRRDFENNYPNFNTYIKRFGSWNNALKFSGLDTDTMIKQGVLDTTNQRGRLSEMIIRDHFGQHPIDLSGENRISPCDGICPNGKIYDVKSSGLHRGTYWNFNTNNIHKEEIEIYYFLAFNSDWTNLRHTWRVPGEMVEKNHFVVGLNSNYEFNVRDMVEYNITDRLRNVIRNHGFV